MGVQYMGATEARRVMLVTATNATTGILTPMFTMLCIGSELFPTPRTSIKHASPDDGHKPQCIMMAINLNATPLARRCHTVYHTMPYGTPHSVQYDAIRCDISSTPYDMP